MGAGRTPPIKSIHKVNKGLHSGGLPPLLAYRTQECSVPSLPPTQSLLVHVHSLGRIGACSERSDQLPSERQRHKATLFLVTEPNLGWGLQLFLPSNPPFHMLLFEILLMHSLKKQIGNLVNFFCFAPNLWNEDTLWFFCNLQFFENLHAPLPFQLAQFV